jgi:transposase
MSVANAVDITLLEETLYAVVERPEPSEDDPQHLCLDKAYDSSTGYAICEQFGYTPHLRRIGEEKKDEQGEKKYPARRRVAERTLTWLSKCRGIQVRYDSPLRQESQALSGADQAGLRPALVPKAAPNPVPEEARERFVIVW